MYTIRTIYDLKPAEIETLDGWCSRFDLDVISHDFLGMKDIWKMRSEWIDAGGDLPVTDAKALFLRPAKADA